MQVQTTFVFHTEEEFTAFAQKFLGVVPVKSEVEHNIKGAEKDKKPVSLNQKLAAKAEKEKAPEKEEVQEDQNESEAEIDFGAVGEAILNLSKKKGRDAAVAVLAKFGYKKVDANMKAEDYTKVVEACKEALTE